MLPPASTSTPTPTSTPNLYPPVLFPSPQHSIGDTLSLSATKSFQTVSDSLDKGVKMEAMDFRGEFHPINTALGKMHGKSPQVV